MMAASSKHVSFSKRVRVKKTLAYVNYTRDEMAATWYDTDEIEDISIDNQETVQKMNNQEILDENEQCQRGLEGKTPQGKELRLKRKEAKTAVLATQEKLRRNGLQDGDELASVYADHTYWCRFAAQARGQSDEQVAQELHGTTSCENKLGDDATCERRAVVVRERRRSIVQQSLRQIAGSAA